MDFDIDNILAMTYEEYIDSLFEKYGRVPCDYFTDSSFQKKNREIIRTEDGLWCHHIDEDKIPNLSSKPLRAYDAVRDPSEYQKAERLVYCNYIEHMLLHMKIFEKEIKKPYDEQNHYDVVGLGGFNTLAGKIDKLITFPRYYKRPYLISKMDEINYMRLDNNWITLYLMSIKYFVENIENSLEFKSWSFGHQIGRSTLVHRIYRNHPINYNGIKTME